MQMWHWIEVRQDAETKRNHLQKTAIGFSTWGTPCLVSDKQLGMHQHSSGTQQQLTPKEQLKKKKKKT